MNKAPILLLVSCLLVAALLSASCSPTATPTAKTTSTPTFTTTQTTTSSTSPKTTTTAGASTTTTSTPSPSALYVPQGQQFTGAIQVRADKTYYSIDTAPLCAYGGAPLSGYTWKVANLSVFPPGTSVDPLTGMFHASGGTLLPGTHKFNMEVSDSSKTAIGAFSFTVATGEILGVAQFQQSGAPTIPLPDAKTGVGYGASLWAVGDSELPWSWYLRTGELPPGMAIDRASGVVRGTPFSSAAGNTYKFTVTVKDKTGKEAISVSPDRQPPTYTISVK